MIELLPPEIAARLQAFLASGKTGSVELHVNAGVIQSWKIVETGRVLTNAAQQT